MDGKALKAQRQALHWTQAQFARVCGVHANTVAKWEAGVQPVPRMAEALLMLLAYRDNQALAEKKYLLPP